jgi:hypothetical protein
MGGSKRDIHAVAFGVDGAEQADLESAALCRHDMSLRRRENTLPAWRSI